MSIVNDAISSLARTLGVTVLGPVLFSKNGNPEAKFNGAAGIEIFHDKDAELDAIPETEGHSIIRISLVKATGESVVITSTVNRDELRRLLGGE